MLPRRDRGRRNDNGQSPALTLYHRRLHPASHRRSHDPNPPAGLLRRMSRQYDMRMSQRDDMLLMRRLVDVPMPTNMMMEPT